MTLEVKTCSKCGQTKKLSEFSRNRTQRDGFYYSCKVCRIAQNLGFRLKRREKNQEYMKQYYLIESNRTIKHAEDAFNRAVLAGKIERKPCVLCGKDSEGHHAFGYDDPYRVIWLCREHHILFHTVRNDEIKNKCESLLIRERRKAIKDVFRVLKDVEVPGTKHTIGDLCGTTIKNILKQACNDIAKAIRGGK